MEESSLRAHVSALRKALGDGQDGSRFIASIPGRGYCFVAAVTRHRESPLPAADGAPRQRSNLPAPLSPMAGSRQHRVDGSHDVPKAPSRTDIVEFAGRSQWLIAEPGYDEMAGRALGWITVNVQ